MEFKQIIDSISSIIFVGSAVSFDFTTTEAKRAFLSECFVTFKNKRGAELSGRAKDLLDEITIEKEKSCNLEIVGDSGFSFNEKDVEMQEWVPLGCVISKGNDRRELGVRSIYTR